MTMLTKTLSPIMKKIILGLLVLVSCTGYAQNAVELGPAEQKLNDAVCACLTNQDMSAVATKEQAASVYNGCIMQQPELIIKLATERKLSLNDQQSMNVLSAEVGKSLVARGCLAATQLALKMSGVVDSVNNSSIKPTPRPTGQDSIYVSNIKRGAEAIVKALFAGDFETVLKYTYPEVLKGVGQKDFVVETLKKSIVEMKDQGITFKNATIGQPGEIIKAKNKIFSIIPQDLFLNVNGKTLYNKASMLAISLDNGVNWYFIDGSGLTDEMIHELFPEANHKLILPKKTTPILLD